MLLLFCVWINVLYNQMDKLASHFNIEAVAGGGGGSRYLLFVYFLDKNINRSCCAMTRCEQPLTYIMMYYVV